MVREQMLQLSQEGSDQVKANHFVDFAKIVLEMAFFSCSTSLYTLGRKMAEDILGQPVEDFSWKKVAFAISLNEAGLWLGQLLDNIDLSSDKVMPGQFLDQNFYPHFLYGLV
jgi:hypothetical protein